jgi:hypothetical protein
MDDDKTAAENHIVVDDMDDGVPDFIPRRHELLVLAKYWEKVRLDNLFFQHCVEMSMSVGMRWRYFADTRINLIIDALKDDEAVKKALREAEDEFAKEHGGPDSLAWRTFIGTATPEEKAQWRAKLDAANRFHAEHDHRG